MKIVSLCLTYTYYKTTLDLTILKMKISENIQEKRATDG